MARTERVLDASALLAYLRLEPGWETVHRWLEQATISSVNWSEVLQKLIERGAQRESIDMMRSTFEQKGLRIRPFDSPEVERAAYLIPQTKGKGQDVSFADRCCLALAIERDVPALTADTQWLALPHTISDRVEPIRMPRQ